jgi:dienelactone hydrolase
MGAGGENEYAEGKGEVSTPTTNDTEVPTPTTLKHGGTRTAVILKRCVMGCLCLFIGVPLITILLVFVISVARVGSSSEFTNVEITGKDGAFGAYYKAPAACADEPCPVAFVFHEWGGLNEDLIQLAEHLVETANVAVLVPDLFRGTSSPTTNVFYNIYRVLNADQVQMDADAEAALAWVSAKPEIDASRVISGPGFCFGGTQSLIFSTRHNISATITLYGSNIDSMAKADDAQWGYLGAGDPLLGIYGEEDQRPSPEHVKAFEKRLAERGVDAEIIIYSGVGHAFVSMAAIEDPSMDDGKSEAAWAKILAFLERAVPRRLSAASPPLQAAPLDSKLDLKPPTWRTNHFGRLMGIWTNECAGE